LDQFWVRTTNDVGPTRGTTLIAASATSYTVTGLSVDDTYHFVVVVVVVAVAVVVVVGADAESWPWRVATATTALGVRPRQVPLYRQNGRST
jgi:hypothetical protein